MSWPGEGLRSGWLEELLSYHFSRVFSSRGAGQELGDDLKLLCKKFKRGRIV